jgi:Zn-dependent protease
MFRRRQHSPLPRPGNLDRRGLSCLVLFLVIFWLSDFYGDVLDKPSGSTEPYLLAVASAVGFFGSIVLHELGHAFEAQRHGIGITTIRLWIFGMADGPSRTLRDRVQGGCGRPAMTLLIAILLIAYGIFSAGFSDFRDAMELKLTADTTGITTMIAWLASINLIVLAFNLLPAFPMDGGRIVRAIAWKITGKRSAATRFAAGLGRIFGYLFIGLGLFWAVSGSVFSGVWLALIGFLITGSAKAATAQTSITSKIEDVRVADVMDTQPVTMPGSITIETALDEYFLRYQWSWFGVTDAEGHFLGVIQRESAEAVPVNERKAIGVSDLIETGTSQYRIEENAYLESLLGNPDMRRFGALFVTDVEGRLSGVITVEQLGMALRA